MRPRFISMDLDNIATGSMPISSINVNLRKLAALGGRKREGQILKVAHIVVVLPITFDANSATLSGIISGRRFYEVFRSVQLAPAGWPVTYSHDASGKALRQHYVHINGHLENPDPTDAADDDHADTAKRLVLRIPFWRDRAPRPEDWCPPAVHVGEGTLQLALQELEISGVSDEKVAAGAKVYAECFYGDMEVPQFMRVRERQIGTTIQRWNLNVDSDRLASAWLHINWSQAAGTDHLVGTFNEDRIVQLNLDGTRWIEDKTIGELNEAWNSQVPAHGGWPIGSAEYVTTAIPNTGVCQNYSCPEIVPLLVNYGWNELTTKLPRATQEAFVEFSGQLQDAATGTGRPYSMITDEVFSPKRGGTAVDEFLRVGKADGPVQLKRKTLSKKATVADAKASAVPLKVTPLQKLGAIAKK